MASSFEILCGIAILILILYYYFTSTFDFWKSRGVVGPKPIPFFGSTKDLILIKKSMAHFVKDIYENYKNEPMIGLYANRSPFLLLNDPELIKDILIRDFSKFANRGLGVFEKVSEIFTKSVKLNFN